MGIDVGSVRIGVACSDPDGILATPVETVRRDRSGKHVRRLAELATELGAVEVVVGLPRTLADRTGPSALDAMELADTLAQRIAPTPVRLADERLTTVSAQPIAARGATEPGSSGRSSTRRPRWPSCRAGSTSAAPR